MAGDQFEGDLDWRGLLDGWRNVAQSSSRMHYEAQRRFSRRSRWLGGVATLLTALIGATALKEISGPTSEPVARWIIGAVAAVASMLTGLHTFLGFGARAAAHRSTAAGYAAVYRRINEEITFGRSGLADAKKAADSIRESLDALSRDAPEVPSDILAKYRTPSLSSPSSSSESGREATRNRVTSKAHAHSTEPR